MLRFVSAGLFVLATLPLAGCSGEPSPGTEHQVTDAAKAAAAKSNTDPKSAMDAMKKSADPAKKEIPKPE